MYYLVVPFLNTRSPILRSAFLGATLVLANACGDETSVEPFSPGIFDASVISAVPESGSRVADSGGGTTTTGTTGTAGSGGAGGTTAGGTSAGGTTAGGTTVGGTTGGTSAGEGDAGKVVRDAGSDASDPPEAGAFLGGLFGGGGQLEPAGDAGAGPHDPTKNDLDPKGNVNPMLPPKADNPAECPSLAPPNPVGDCLGLPIYVICGYGKQGGAEYTCTCDWYHWLCI